MTRPDHAAGYTICGRRKSGCAWFCTIALLVTLFGLCLAYIAFALFLLWTCIRIHNLERDRAKLEADRKNLEGIATMEVIAQQERQRLGRKLDAALDQQPREGMLPAISREE